MNKYIGKYRVLCERDLETNKPINNGENTYIKCKKNAQVYRYNDEVLVLYVPSRPTALYYEKCLNNACFRYDYSDYEGQFYFYEENIDKVMEVCKPFVSGKNIKPKNKRSYKENVEKSEGF